MGRHGFWTKGMATLIGGPMQSIAEAPFEMNGNFNALQRRAASRRRFTNPPRASISRADGEMAEWFKAHAWNACVGATLPWVRIPLSPPPTLRPEHSPNRVGIRRQSPAKRRSRFSEKQIIGKLRYQEADAPTVYVCRMHGTWAPIVAAARDRLIMGVNDDRRCLLASLGSIAPAALTRISTLEMQLA
jgi:hypothetical protein